MMELEVQFQVFFMSIIFGMYLLSFWQFLNRVFLHKVFLRFFFELFFFVFNFLLYYFLLFKLNDGVFSIYLLIGLTIGFFLYQKFYASKFLSLYEVVFKKINGIIVKKKKRCLESGKNKKQKKRKKILE